MKSINLEFFFNYDVDADERIRNIFWANASCRGSYEDFGDCITFGTTYKTKKFHMPLGVFVGVNHHLQTMIFVVALVRDEIVISFQWVFRTFVHELQAADLHPNRYVCDIHIAALFHLVWAVQSTSCVFYD